MGRGREVELSQDTEKWQAVVNTVRIVQVP